jgi:hypothetical protein
MTTAVDTLAAVRALGGEVRLANSGRLKVVAPAPLPNELIERLRAVKPDLLMLLTSPKPLSEPHETWTDAEEERAAIVEYDAGVPRAWAEGFARLDPNKPPIDVPPRRWLRFIDDGGRFLDSGWARQADSFGWGPLDLFGCDRERPFARIDHAGLLWLLNGRKLVALTPDTATIETLTGTHQTYRRGSIAYGDATLAWELDDPLEGGRPDETFNDAGPLSKVCAYCGWPGDPLVDAAVDGHMFRAHRACLDLEWQLWRHQSSAPVGTCTPGTASVITLPERPGSGNHDVGRDHDHGGDDDHSGDDDRGNKADGAIGGN